VLKIDPEIERKQVERTQRIRRERDKKKFEEALNGLRNASEGTDNVMPHIINAVKAYATVGEICDVWRDIWGEWDEPKIY
jgi:methylmalonyl-CoA mutase N-terminal domain/subunit